MGKHDHDHDAAHDQEDGDDVLGRRATDRGDALERIGRLEGAVFGAWPNGDTIKSKLDQLAAKVDANREAIDARIQRFTLVIVGVVATALVALSGKIH